MLFLPSPTGWSETQLMAPRAELRLQLTGGSALLDAARLAYLGEGLRSLLVIEARSAEVESVSPLDPPPAFLGPRLAARRVCFRTASGARAAAVLAAPEALVENEALRLYALRQTLVADALATVVSSSRHWLRRWFSRDVLARAARGRGALRQMLVADALATVVGGRWLWGFGLWCGLLLVRCAGEQERVCRRARNRGARLEPRRLCLTVDRRGLPSQTPAVPPAAARHAAADA